MRILAAAAAGLVKTKKEQVHPIKDPAHAMAKGTASRAILLLDARLPDPGFEIGNDKSKKTSDAGRKVDQLAS